jgi:hypothetical protein
LSDDPAWRRTLVTLWLSEFDRRAYQWRDRITLGQYSWVTFNWLKRSVSKFLSTFTQTPIIVAEDSPWAEDGDEILMGSGSTEPKCIARIEPRHNLQSGDRFSCGLSEVRLALFDLESGLAIVD